MKKILLCVLSILLASLCLDKALADKKPSKKEQPQPTPGLQIEGLPPGAVERIVLLAPSVAEDYDLRPALRCARQGLDSFSSSRDVVLLGVGVGVVGTADRRWESAAGRVGFRPLVCGPADGALYGKLREHHWDHSVAWAGDYGGHYGSNHAAFARAYLPPLLTRSVKIDPLSNWSPPISEPCTITVLSLPVL